MKVDVKSTDLRVANVASGSFQLNQMLSLAKHADISLTGCPRTNYSGGCGTNACCAVSCNRTHNAFSKGVWQPSEVEEDNACSYTSFETQLTAALRD